MFGNTLRTLLAFSLAAVLSAGCGPTTASQVEKKYNVTQIPPEQVLQLVEGNTMLLESYYEESYCYFDTSGRMYCMDQYKNKDIGKWDVADTGELCIKLERWWYGDLKCLTMYPAGDRYALANTAGVIAFHAVHFSGDYKHLYYEPKQEKKSYRKSYRTSIRKKETTQPAPEGKPEAEENVPKEEPSAREPEYTYTTSDAELKSTVKWMAKECPGCNLENSNLKKADLVGAKLQGANLSGANLSMADMRRADLRDANLERADLSYANMPGADLRNCNLKHANLKGANLIRANLSGADLEGAVLEGALLEGAEGMP